VKGIGGGYGARIEDDDEENDGGPVSRIAGESEIDVHGAVSCQPRDQLPEEPAEA
jgi:hypothetical protein